MKTFRISHSLSVYYLIKDLTILPKLLAEKRGMRKNAEVLLIRMVAAKIRHYRHALRLTQEDMAEKIGCHVNQYARIERGQSDLSLSMLYRISKALSISVADLLR